MSVDSLLGQLQIQYPGWKITKERGCGDSVFIELRKDSDSILIDFTDLGVGAYRHLHSDTFKSYTTFEYGPCKNEEEIVSAVAKLVGQIEQDWESLREDSFGALKDFGLPDEDIIEDMAFVHGEDGIEFLKKKGLLP
jgi:hypothetical protein